MRVSTQLIIYLIAAQVLISGLTTWMISQLPREIVRQVDREMEGLADRMVAEANRLGRIEVDEIDWPADLDVYSANSTFFVVIRVMTNGEVNIVNHSQAVRPVELLDPQFLTEQVRFASVRRGEQTMRVLTYPLVGQFGDEERLIGYLQIGRLVNDYSYLNVLATTVRSLALAALFVGLAAITWFVPSFTSPLGEITEVAEQITTADALSRRVPNSFNNDEISQLANAINNLIARMEELFKTQQRLLADVSHELRTPLTTIRGNVDLIRRTRNPDLESITAIEQEIERMTRLVNDLLTLARAEVGGLPIVREPVDLDMIFMRIFEDAHQLHGSIKIVLEDVQQARVLGDADRLHQLILNLVSNAIKYTEPGGTVTLSLSVDARHAYIRVSDTGVGIPPEDLRYIFDRFYRVNKGRTRESGGAGLGLAIAQSIARAHNGEIRVKSKVGEGSTFTFQVPLLVRQPTPQPEAQASAGWFGSFRNRSDGG